MDMDTHIKTIILIFRGARVTLAHFKVSQETLKFTPMRPNETLYVSINNFKNTKKYGNKNKSRRNSGY